MDPMSLSEQAPLSGFGKKAAEGADLDELLMQASREIAAGLGVSHVKVLEYLADEKTLLLRAGIGWSEGVVGTARIGVDLASPAGFALQTGRPVISNDLAAEERFRIPEVLARHGVKSAANVIIKSGDFVYGVLEADSFESRRFTPADTQYLQSYANVLALAVGQARLAQENFELTRRLEDMLHELGHRTKNNNQILASLIHMQRRRATALETQEQLDVIRNRLMTLNELDNLILSAKGLHRIDLGKYLVSLVGKILSIDADGAHDIKFRTEVTSVEVDSRIAQPVAMIVNEFVTNSFKHAFPRGAETLTLSLEDRDGTVTITIADDGPGMPDDARRGMGFQLMQAMAEQINATLDWDGAGGTRLRIAFNPAGE
jgi:two-component sensor histidine kinase